MKKEVSNKVTNLSKEHIQDTIIHFADLIVKRNGKKEFISDEHNQVVINHLALFYEKVKERSKGIALYGDNGRGKTVLLQAQYLYIKNRYKVSLGYTTETQIIQIHKDDDWITWNNLLNKKVLYIDEIGSKPPKQNKYGETYPMIEFIEQRAEKKNRLTFCTMNLSLDSGDMSILNIYGGRMHSRMNRIFNKPLFLNGEDKS